MRNLFLFLFRYHAFFLFLILQVACLFLIIKNNTYQRAAFFNITEEVTGRTMSAYNEIASYLTLGEENKKLAMENAKLHNLLPAVYYNDTSGIYVKKDSSRLQFYSFVPARVIQITTNRSNNYIVIDKGALADIQPRMGVVGPNGVVGIVKDVSPHFAALYSVLHSQVTVSARVGRKGSRGTIRWDGRNSSYVNLEEITRQEVLHEGDTIFTSGVSRIFPDNIPIGTIDQFELVEPGNFYSIRVKLATDYRRIEFVYVVHNHMHAEIDSLLIKAENVK